ncbi:ADP-ribosylation factor-like protein 13B [Dirofilaria immitis]
MGNCVGGFKKRRRKLQHQKKFRKIRICILGLDGAGKSTAICALASGELNDILPTNGFALQEFRYKKAEIIAYDLGGGSGIRSIWKNYYPEVFGVIYVIDGSERKRIEESGRLLKDVISDEDLHNKPFLIILNKKDRERCIDEIQFSDRFNLHTLANQYQTQIRVEICQSNIGSGKMIDSTLKDGFEWLLEQIYHDYEILEKKVNEALEKFKRRQNEERIRRQHHLATTVSCSTISEDQASDIGAVEVTATATTTTATTTATTTTAEPTTTTVQHSKQPIDENKHIDRSAVMPSTNVNIDQINNSEIENKKNKQKRLQRNVINPTKDLSPESNDPTVTMKYPEIFEVKALFEQLQESKKANRVNMNGIISTNNRTENANLQSTSKPARITQFVPLTIIPHQQSRRPVRPNRRWRTDSI